MTYDYMVVAWQLHHDLEDQVCKVEKSCDREIHSVSTKYTLWLSLNLVIGPEYLRRWLTE